MSAPRRLSAPMRGRPALATAAPPELDGLAGAWLTLVRRVKSFVEIFPPLGVGLGGGIALGCGLGWPLRRAMGPPRAYCGPGIGVGVGIGYGQGVGRRFGRDNRSEEARARIRALETTIDDAFRAVRQRLGLAPKPLPAAARPVLNDATTGFRADDEDAIDGVLVWLLAGAAAETAIDGALIESDTASAYRLLRLVRDGARGKKSRDQERVAAAYATATELVEEHAAVLDALSARMLRRESAGECVAFLGEAFDQASQQAQIHKA